jgi:hypothetical protein
VEPPNSTRAVEHILKFLSGSLNRYAFFVSYQ